MSPILLPSRLRALLGLSLALGLTALLRAEDAPPKATPLGENEKIAVSAPDGGDAALHLTVTLDRSHVPASAGPATLAIVNSSDYVWWSGPLQASGTTYSVDLPPKAASSILICDRAEVRFAADAKGPPVAAVKISHDRLTGELAGVTPQMHGKPMFFTPPDPGKPPAPPAVAVKRSDAESYISAAEKWDSELQASLYDFDNQLVHARSLWRDLDTAGKLPWKDARKAQLADLYGHVESHRTELNQLRDQNQAQARDFARKWNAQHAGDAGERTVEANFYNA